MIKNEVLLLKENALFIFDRRNIRLFRIVKGQRLEIRDRDYIGNIVISNAAVLSMGPTETFDVLSVSTGGPGTSFGPGG